MPETEPPSIAEEIEEAERRIVAAERRLEAGRAARAEAEQSMRAEVERLRGEFDAARERAAREVAALHQRLDRADLDTAEAVAALSTRLDEGTESRERLGEELARIAEALGKAEEWHEGVDRDLGRMTAELAQRAAAIDDANAAIDELRGSDRLAEMTATVATLRAEQAELLAAADERELRTDAAEGRVAALEAAAEAFSDRLHGLEAGAEAAAEEARRLRAATDRREHDERLATLERRLAALESDPAAHVGEAKLVATPPQKPNAQRPKPNAQRPRSPTPLTPGGKARLPAALRGRDAPWPPRAWLPAALGSLAADDPEAVISVMSELVKVSEDVAEQPLRLELTVDETTLKAGPEDAKRRLAIRADALALAELLDGRRGTRARMHNRLEIKGRKRRARKHLAALGRATRSPANLARSGAKLDPVVLARAIANRAEPTGDHRLTLAVALDDTTFTVTTAGGLAIEDGAPDHTPDATVTTTTLGFYRWLSGEPLDEPVGIDGDAEAVALIAGWAERAIER